MNERDTIAPLWVRIARWGLPHRNAVLACQWISILLGAACMVAGFWDVRLFAGAAFFSAALWYWAAIQWVDRHGAW